MFTQLVMIKLCRVNLTAKAINQIWFQQIDIIPSELISRSSRYLLIMMSMCFYNVRTCSDIDVNEAVVIRANNKNVHPHLSCCRHIN